MTPTHLRALATLSGVILLGGLAGPPVTAQPEDAGSPGGQAAVPATQNGPELEDMAGLDVLVQDNELLGITARSAADSPVVRTVAHEGHLILNSTDEAMSTSPTSDLTALSTGGQPIARTIDDVTTLLAPAGLSTAEVTTPDYCRDPAYANPTRPAPGKVPVTVAALDRDGDPARGNFTMMDFHCEPYEANGYIAFSVSAAEPHTFYLPAGTYSLIGEVTTLDDSGQHDEELTFGGYPEFTVAAEPVTLTVDARDGEPLSVATPRPSNPVMVVLGWQRGIEGNAPLMSSTVVLPGATTLGKVSVIPSEPVTDGTFTFFPWLRSTEPMVSGTVLGGGRPLELGLRHLNPYDTAALTGQTRLHLGLEGAAPGDAVLLTDGPHLQEQVNAAQAAAASAVIVAPAGPGLTDPTVASGLPLLTLSAEDAAEATKRLRGPRGWAPMFLETDAYPDYLYDLVDALPNVVSEPYADLGTDDLTKVVQHFQTDGLSVLMLESREPRDPCRCLLTPFYDIVEAGSTRTDYVINNGSRWQQTVIDSFNLTARTPLQAYDGQTRPENRWLGGSVGSGLTSDTGPTEPRAPATTADGEMRLSMGSVDGAGHTVLGGVTRSGSVSRNGEVVTPDFTGFALFEPEEVPADWRIELNTAHAPQLWRTSTSVSSVWEFSAAPHTGPTAQALPLIDVSTSYPVDLHSQRVTDGQLVITPWRLDAGSARGSELTVEISRDGGSTWVPQDGQWADGSWTATPVLGSGPVDLRVNLTGADGSTLTRTVQHAWTD